MIANGMRVARIGDVTTPVERPEVPLAGTTYRQIGVRLWGVGAYERESMDGSQTRYTTLSRVESGDIIVNKIWARNGSVAVVPDELDGCFGSGEFPTFKPDRAKLEPKWFHWVTKTKWFWQACDEKSQGTSGKNRIRPEKFLEIEIPLPSLKEQCRIVRCIEALAGRVAEAQSLRREANEEVEALFASAITNLPFDNKHWKNVDFALSKKKAAIHSGPFGSDLIHGEFVESGVAAIGTRDIRVNKFELGSGWYVTSERYERLKQYQIFPGDVLVTIIGGSIGRFCVTPENVPLAFTTKHVVAMQFDPSLAEPHFMSYMLNFHARCRETMFSQAAGSAQPSLNITKIKGIEVPIPPLEEQRRLVAYLDGLQAQMSQLRAQQEEMQKKLDALMPSILDKAFKGDL